MVERSSRRSEALAARADRSEAVLVFGGVAVAVVGSVEMGVCGLGDRGCVSRNRGLHGAG